MRGKRILIGRNKISIRTANEDDIEKISDLRVLQQHDDWGSDYPNNDNDFYNRTLSYMNTAIRSCDFKMFVAEIEGSIIATCGLQVIHMLPQCNDEGKYGFICNVFTQEEFRQHGIQSMLIEKVLVYAKEQKISEIKLETDNEIAIKLYEKYGFKTDTLSMVKEI